jgi:hypothetical protein
MKKILITFLILTAFQSNLRSQDISNAYNVFGFRAPFLQSGEFVATFNGNYYSYENDYTYEYEPDRFNTSNYGYMNFYARGLLAITDKVLIYTTLYLYPKYEREGKYGDNTYKNETTSTQNTYVYPYITLIFRPKRNLELSGSLYTYNRKYGYETTYSNPDQDPYAYEYDTKYFGGNLSINYFGKLWNK